MGRRSLRVAVVGDGRLGRVLVRALTDAGYAVPAPLGRGAAPDPGTGLVLLAVPDDQIAAAATALTPRDGLLVAHCSGATTLEPLVPHRGLSLHPLMTFTGEESSLRGVPAALAGTDAGAEAVGRGLAADLGMTTFAVAEADRAAYHAGATMAANHLLALQWAASRAGGLPPEALAPLVRATVDNWARLGPRRALTGPAVRGDTATVERHRAALADDPDLLAAYDALHRLTLDLAARPPDAREDP